MRAHYRLLGLATAFTLGIVPCTVSAYCVGWDKNVPGYDAHYYSVGHESRRSRYVVKAKVVDEIWIGENGKRKSLEPPFQFGGTRPWGFDPYLGAFYDVRVERIFKGKPPTTIRVFSENSSARFWLKKGSEILAFVDTGKFDQPIGSQLTLDTCGNLALYPTAQRLEPAILKASRSKR